MPAFLKCDAPGCDHVESVEAISRDLIGFPCPKCGASLLTADDCMKWLHSVQPGIDTLKALGLIADRAPVDGDLNAVRIHLHGSDLTFSTKLGGADDDDPGAP
jgi:predicted RNA-binding Zn-ribbon protein involved in translation (DUF1610 family)